MSIELCVSADQLRAALTEIEAAERNGFEHCLAVFTLTSAGDNLDECRARYSDLLERAHPTDERLNWGRFQRVSKRYQFKGGELVKLPDGVGIPQTGQEKNRASGIVQAERRPLGCALAMRVMQSDLYKQLDDAERADCDELVQQNLEWFRRDARGVTPCDGGQSNG